MSTFLFGDYCSGVFAGAVYVRCEECQGLTGKNVIERVGTSVEIKCTASVEGANNIERPEEFSPCKHRTLADIDKDHIHLYAAPLGHCNKASYLYGFVTQRGFIGDVPCTCTCGYRFGVTVACLMGVYLAVPCPSCKTKVSFNVDGKGLKSFERLYSHAECNKLFAMTKDIAFHKHDLSSEELNMIGVCKS